MHFKMSTAKCRLYFIGLSVLKSCQMASDLELSGKAKQDLTFIRNVAHTVTPNWPELDALPLGTDFSLLDSKT